MHKMYEEPLFYGYICLAILGGLCLGVATTEPQKTQPDSSSKAYQQTAHDWEEVVKREGATKAKDIADCKKLDGAAVMGFGYTVVCVKRLQP